MATSSLGSIGRIGALLAWFKLHKHGIEAAAKTLAVVGAAITFIGSETSKHFDRQAQRAVETYQYLLKYPKESEVRTPIATSPQLQQYFDSGKEVPAAVIQLLIASQDPQDKALRRQLIAYVNHCESLALARNNGVFHKKIFDGQFAKILIQDYTILRQFLLQTRAKGATYPEWRRSLIEWEIAGGGDLPG